MFPWDLFIILLTISAIGIIALVLIRILSPQRRSLLIWSAVILAIFTFVGIPLAVLLNAETLFAILVIALMPAAILIIGIGKFTITIIGHGSVLRKSRLAVAGTITPPHGLVEYTNHE